MQWTRRNAFLATVNQEHGGVLGSILDLRRRHIACLRARFRTSGAMRTREGEWWVPTRFSGVGLNRSLSGAGLNLSKASCVYVDKLERDNRVLRCVGRH